MRTASLPMYDLPEVRAATAAFWASLAGNLRRHGIADVPDKLIHDRPVGELWTDPGLLLSQCCGYDVLHGFDSLLLPIATPEYAAPGCLGGTYSSMVVVADDCPFDDAREMRGAVAVINGAESHSGMSALRHLVSSRHIDGQFFSGVKVSGSHIASLGMIRRRQADIAAIDCVTLALIQRHIDGAMRGVRILGATYRAPAPPYVVRASATADEIGKVRAAIVETFDDPSLADCRDTLLLKGVALATREDYWVLGAFQDHAGRLGYPVLQ
ncbi:MAG: phosphate/phosphite/phosphonate ABC transporter substrate-binding protein [Alphaproteobacteria bacterium]